MTKVIKRVVIKTITTTNNILNTKEQILSIQLSLGGFSFCIRNKYNKHICRFENILFAEKAKNPAEQLNLVKNVFEKHTILNQTFSEVHVIHNNNLVTQVPQVFFDKNKLENYLNFSIKLLDNDFITYDEIAHTTINNVYIPFVNINNFLIDKYGAFNYKHSATILIENLIQTFKNSIENQMVINVVNDSYELVILKEGQFVLYNNFEFNTKEDFIYYLLFSIEQVDINPALVKVTFMGDIEKESEIFNICFQYIKNIDFYKPKNFPEMLEPKFSKHQFFTLLNS
ncbi:MAG: DUF3822 family protein [Lutibacter sp.]